MSEYRATSSRNARATSSASGPCRFSTFIFLAFTDSEEAKVVVALENRRRSSVFKFCLVHDHDAIRRVSKVGNGDQFAFHAIGPLRLFAGLYVVRRPSLINTVSATLSSPSRTGSVCCLLRLSLWERLSTSGNFTTGGLTALRGFNDDSSIIQVSAPMQPGNSGGPLMD